MSLRRYIDPLCATFGKFAIGHVDRESGNVRANWKAAYVTCDVSAAENLPPALFYPTPFGRWFNATTTDIANFCVCPKYLLHLPSKWVGSGQIRSQSRLLRLQILWPPRTHHPRLVYRRCFIWANN